MKEMLAMLYDPRKREKFLKFKAIFDRYGTRPSKLKNHPEPYPTALLKNVRHKSRGATEETIVADHLWLKDAMCLPPLNPGQEIEFQGRIDMFAKGSYECDFHVIDITDVKLLKKENL